VAREAVHNRYGEEKAVEGRGRCRASLDGPTRLWFCRQNRAGAEPRGRSYPYTFLRGRDLCVTLETGSVRIVRLAGLVCPALLAEGSLSA
jgi:hypothetical protein